MNLFLAPHNDDETLFGAFTLIREKPLVLVVTDSFVQPLRGDHNCSADARWKETVEACGILGCAATRGGIPDNEITSENVEQLLRRFEGFDSVYIPAIQHGHPHHDLISEVAKRVFGARVIEYTTYTRTELWTKGTQEIIPTQEEIELKNKALGRYTSQLNLMSTRPHFDAVIGKSEWYIK